MTETQKEPTLKDFELEIQIEYRRLCKLIDTYRPETGIVQEAILDALYKLTNSALNKSSIFFNNRDINQSQVVMANMLGFVLWHSEEQKKAKEPADAQ